MKAKGPILGFGALILLLVTVFVWQWQTGVKFRTEAALRRAEAEESMRLRDRHRQLAAQQVSAAEIANLRADHAEAVRLREEMDRLAQKLAEQPPPAAEPEASPAPTTDGLDREPIPASAWKNAGTGTPQSTLQTALWAAAAGNLDALAETLNLDGTARAKAQALFAAQPEEVRAQYATPERFVALLATRDMPLTSLQVSGALVQEHDAQLVVNLPTSERTDHLVKLTLSRGSDGWRLNVPETAIDRYARQAAGAAGRSAGSSP